MMTIPRAIVVAACPDGLDFEQVQILVRHGERTPIQPRFQNTGLSPHWPYCSAAQRFSQAVMSAQDGSKWETMPWKRRLETSGPDGQSIPAQGPGGETSSNMCMPGELTDKGRETTLAFGKWLRRVYVDQLCLLPKHLNDAKMVYARTTEIPRVVESVQQILHGLYPSGTNQTGTPWDIAVRSRADETLLPSKRHCARLAELARDFSQAAATKWNESDDMNYLSKKLGKWMPSNKALTVDSQPPLSAVMDSINATLAHGPDTRLPDEFYDERVRKAIDHIVLSEKFGGYGVSRELRMLGTGQLMGGIVLKMVDQAEWNRRQPMSQSPNAQSNAPPRLSLLGCHDTTIGRVLASLGCLDGCEKWPPFTSHISFELFRKKRAPSPKGDDIGGRWLWKSATTSLLSSQRDAGRPCENERRVAKQLMTQETQGLEEYFVRVVYNDRIMTIPGCRAEGKHLDGDTSICTLSAFKSIIDKFTPVNWIYACNSNLGALSATRGNEPAGF
ncbi:histidine phosphatase superfamily [Podospora didyma]|uniref:Histidine phosphatase superfamily n=1 Tax=Podospora didyma TaxID=330526 RepID=A0AAE0NTU1_9PEZI|nr:histidine phosphatase superfamily [Podospora didyma]